MHYQHTPTVWSDEPLFSEPEKEDQSRFPTYTSDPVNPVVRDKEKRHWWERALEWEHERAERYHSHSSSILAAISVREQPPSEALVLLEKPEAHPLPNTG